MVVMQIQVLPTPLVRVSSDLEVLLRVQKEICCSVTKPCLVLYNPMNRKLGFSVLHHLPETAQTHV